MSGRWTRRVAWTVAAAALASLGAALFLGLQRRGEDLGHIQPFIPTEVLLFGSALAAFALMGALIVSRQPRNRIGWVFLGVGFAQIFGAFGTEYGAFGLVRSPGSVPLAAEVLWLSDLLGSLAFAAFPLFFLLFPDGRLVSRRWRVVIGALGVAAAMLALHSLMSWGFRGPRMLSPVEVEDVGWMDYLGEIAFPVVTFALLGGAISLVVRFRRGSVEQRQQVKWLAYSALVFAVLILLDGIEVFGDDNITALVIGGLSMVMLPVGAGIAILRYRLYDIDVVINRTLVYAALTALLGGTYLGVVVLLQNVLQPLTAESDLAVAGSTLAVAALFRPLRVRVQSFVDKRFYRRKYNAAETLGAFSGHLRDEVDLDSLCRRLLDVVRSTMAPSHATVWLRDRREDVSPARPTR